MKALTLWQPWASLMALGHKKIETLSWSTRYRGPLVIHAARSVPNGCGLSAQRPEFRQRVIELGLCDYELPQGAVVATADLIEVAPITAEMCADLSTDELIFGNYEDGRYAWFFENVRPVDPAIPAKGNRLLWEWPERIFA